MRVFSRASAALLAGVVLAAPGCSQLGRVQAMRAYKAANQAYTQQQYAEAAQLYEEAIAQDPELAPVYFYLANSYDQQYRATRAGQPENDALLQKAEQHYQTAADRLLASTDDEQKKLGRLSLDYLRALYTDKMNDPAKAELVVQRMIQIEPGEPTNYFALAKIYEDAGAYAEAEQMLVAARDARPTDSRVYTMLAGYYNRQGEFEKTIAALEERASKEPDNPEAHFVISTYYWDNVQRNYRLRDDERRDQVERGLAAVDKALSLKRDYMEALVYKGLLLRLQANLEKDPARQQALIKEADGLRDQADEIRKKRAAGV
jgi:tetratricopeptide (TPR) repeat protein